MSRIPVLGRLRAVTRERRGYVVAVALGIGLGVLILLAWPDRPAPTEVSLTEIDRAIAADDVDRALIDDDARTIRITRRDGSVVRAAYPSSLGSTLAERLLDAGVEVKVAPAAGVTSIWARLGVALLPLLILILVFAIFSRRLRTGASAFSGGRGGEAEVPDTRFAD